MELFGSNVTFRLSKDFVSQFKNVAPPFGFNGLGELTYMRTYSRVKDNGEKEKWYETVERVVNGCFSIQKRWIDGRHLGWSEEKAQRSAEEMYRRIFHMKFLPPGRGLWAMGSSVIEERGLFASLSNCGFVSTVNMSTNPVSPFSFMMDAVMLGVGVGFDTKGAGTAKVYKPNGYVYGYNIGDSREGWVDSVSLLLGSFFFRDSGKPLFDYSNIRPAGSPIKGFGGTAAGPEGLLRAHVDIEKCILEFLGDETEKVITENLIVDLMNLVGRAVVSGGVRRSAQIALGMDSDEYLDLKDYSKNPHRIEYGWTSNNSIFAEVGQDYSRIVDRIKTNGEPGIVWLKNAKNYSRMGSTPDFKDESVAGCNPCFHPDTRISTNRGLVCIKDLESEVLVQSNDGIMRRGLVFPTGIKEVLEIHTKHGRLLKVTENHQIMTSRGWVEAAQLTESDQLILQNSVGMFGGKSNIPLDLFKVFGWLVGDGYISNGRPHAVFGKDDNDCKLEIERILLLNGYKFNSFKQTSGSVGENPYRMTISKKFMGLGDYHCTEGVKASVKVIPDAVFRSSMDEQLAFLSGLFSADGTVNIREGKSFDLRLASSSIELLRGVQLILSNMGILSKIYQNRQNRNANKFTYTTVSGEFREYESKNYHDLIVNGESLRLLKLNLIRIGMVSSRKSSKLELISDEFDNYGHNRFVDTVKEIVRNGEVVTVYDVSEPETNSLTANGVIVHNCGEQFLNSYELCCLVESFPEKHESKDDFLTTLKYAYLYAKTVTLCPTHWPETNRVMLKNRRIGCSISGVAQFISRKGLPTLIDWCNSGYSYLTRLDCKYSDWFTIPRSIKMTTVKPSGSVSLLAGVTPGMHFPESRFYIRRIRLSSHSDLVQPIIDAGYYVEPSAEDPQAVVVEIPVDSGDGIRSASEVSMWEQLNIAAMLQRYWSDNSVSVTVTFDPDAEVDQVKHAIEYFQYNLKSVSFLPRVKNGAYQQMPYETITREKYEEMKSRILPINFESVNSEAEVEKYCTSDVCEVKIG